MPTYDYQCACGQRVTAARAIAERDHAPLCCACWPADGTAPAVMRRRLTTAGVAFRGTGFYSTDSRRPGAS